MTSTARTTRSTFANSTAKSRLSSEQTTSFREVLIFKALERINCLQHAPDSPWSPDLLVLTRSFAQRRERAEVGLAAKRSFLAGSQSSLFSPESRRRFTQRSDDAQHRSHKPVARLTPVGETNEIVSRLIAEGVELPAEGPPLDVEKLFSLVDQLCHWNGIFRRLLLFDIHSTIMANYHHDQDAGSDSR